MNKSNTHWRYEYIDQENTLPKFRAVMEKYRIKNGEAKMKRDVVLSAWTNYCRESFIYRVLEFFKLR